MCRRAGPLAALLLAAAGPALAAQQAAVRARADSLLREWREAETLAELQDSLRSAAQGTGRDTVRVGALWILANPSPLPLEQAAALAWPVIEEFYGPAAADFERHPFIVNAIDPDTAAGPPTPQPGIQVPWNLDARRLAGLLSALADLSEEAPVVREWLAGPLLPADSSSRWRFAGAYVQLVIAPTTVSHRCLLGDRPACRQALSLDSAPDPATQWFGPDGRRRLVTTMFAGLFENGAHQAAWEACRDGRDAACVQLLHTLPAGSVPPPLDYPSRFSFLETARRLGGPETFARLFAAPPGPMGARIAFATGISEDSLVERWRQAVLAARPHSVALPSGAVWLTLGWAGVFLTCGLRSSRWRVT